MTVKKYAALFVFYLFIGALLGVWKLTWAETAKPSGTPAEIDWSGEAPVQIYSFDVRYCHRDKIWWARLGRLNTNCLVKHTDGHCHFGERPLTEDQVGRILATIWEKKDQ